MNNFILDKQNLINCLKKSIASVKVVFRMHTFFYVRYYVKKDRPIIKNNWKIVHKWFSLSAFR